MNITRRALLKRGLLSSAGLVLAGGLASPVGLLRAAPSIVSPWVEPFQAPLPIPPVLQPVSSDTTTDYYEMTQKVGQAHILPGLITPIWGYNGIFPGPTIEARCGCRVVIRQMNELPVPVSTHLHGGIVSPENDDDPTDLIWPATSDQGARRRRQKDMQDTSLQSGMKDYIYLNNQSNATLWYHDHRMNFTGPQIYKGLAGFYLLKDELEEQLPLPTGERDIPIMIVDRIFRTDGSLFYPSLDPTLTTTPGVWEAYQNGVCGDTILVNGALQPFFEVANTRYRFRLLNASNARQFRLALSTEQPFVQVGSDGGLLPAPVSRRTIDIAQAERCDVLIDFSDYPIGTQIVLKNLWGTGRTADIMRFDVVRQEEDESVVPSQLAPLDAPDITSVEAIRAFRFLMHHDKGTINGKSFDAHRTDALLRLNASEIWELMGNGDHPIHIHNALFQVLDRDGDPPDPHECGLKDIIFLRKGECARILVRFTDYRGPYVFHCHNLEHEDMGMMSRFEVV